MTSATFRWLWTLVLVVAVVGLPLSAGAEEQTPSLAQARAAFLQGRALMEAQRWQEAEEKFAYAARAKNTPGLRYYIALCLQNQDRLLEALEEYKRTEQLLETQPTPDVADLIGPAIAQVKEIMPHLIVQGVPATAKVWVDGQPLEHGNSMFLDPGNHDLLVTAEGYQDYRVAFLAKRSSTSVIQADLERDELPAQRRSAPVDNRRPSRRSAGNQALFWSGVSLGALGLGTGIVGTGLYIDATGKLHDWQDTVDELAGASNTTCSRPALELQSACRELDQASKRQNTALAVLVAGYTASAVGIVGAILSQVLQKPTSSQRKAQAAATDLWVSFAPEQGGGLASLGGRF